jgi:hypothetical protein
MSYLPARLHDISVPDHEDSGWSFRMSVTIYHSTWHNIPEDTDLILFYLEWAVIKKKKKWQEVVYTTKFM